MNSSCHAYPVFVEDAVVGRLMGSLRATASRGDPPRGRAATVDVVFWGLDSGCTWLWPGPAVPWTPCSRSRSPWRRFPRNRFPNRRSLLILLWQCPPGIREWYSSIFVVKDWMKKFDQNLTGSGIQKLLPRYDKRLNVNGKWREVVLCSFIKQ